MPIARFEKDGRVAFSDGSRVMEVPSERALKERLIQLLEVSGGDKEHQVVSDFWRDRVRDLSDEDEMRREWAREIFLRLDAAWEELTEPPAPSADDGDDVFAVFGL